jgi:hypothetical protein
MIGLKQENFLTAIFSGVNVNKCAIAIILLSYPSLAIAHGSVGELIGVFLVLFLLQIAGVCLAILLGWRFSWPFIL